MSDFPLSEYLDRIGWERPLLPDPETLCGLHRAQALAIPFENLDSFAGYPVSLDANALVDKLICRRRGGYCFELNGLFLLALNAIGFRTRSLCARVLISEGNYGPRSHQITLVEFDDGPWLADVGFGGNSLIEAIPFVLEREFDQGLDRFRLMKDATHGYRLEHSLPGGWRANYAFSLDLYLPSDYQALNYYICRAPSSIFTQIPICVRTTAKERRIIVANQFKVRAPGELQISRGLSSSNELRAVLESEFDIKLPGDHLLPEPAPAPPGIRAI